MLLVLPGRQGARNVASNQGFIGHYHANLDYCKTTELEMISHYSDEPTSKALWVQCARLVHNAHFFRHFLIVVTYENSDV